MDLDLQGALLKECPSCHKKSPLSAESCDHCKAVFSVEEEKVALNFTAEDYSEEPQGYVPLHKSPNLLALREAVEELRADTLDFETYLEVIEDVQRGVQPLLKRFEQQLRVLGDHAPPDLASLLKDGLQSYRDYDQGMERMKSEPERGLVMAEVALKKLDQMERQL
jgi:hypothetical protein